MDVYPIFLTGLAERRCVVIGGGEEAERKVKGLRERDAAVTVISADLTTRLRAWVESGSITWVPRAYQPGDLQGAFLVIATENAPHLNTCIWQEARTVGALINVVDDPAHSTFVAGSVVRQGALTVAISTSGYAPALAVRLRQQLEQTFGPEYAGFLDLMQEMRATLAVRIPDAQERRARWYALVDSDILTLLRDGQTELAQQRARAIVEAPVLGCTEEGRRDADGRR
jgi:siroheme synthase-like protein